GGRAVAIVWDRITWYWGLPTSSSHALIGGFAGAAVAKAGFGSLIGAGLIKIGVFMLLAPVIGLTVGFAMLLATVWIFKDAHPGRVGWRFCRLQPVWAAACSLGDGTKAAQTTMGVVAVPPVAADCSSSRPRRTASATAPTTPRRRWGSSRCYSSRPATSVGNSTCRSG